jgi:hypothetical protein
MKKIALSLLFASVAGLSHGQTLIRENFDVDCVLSGNVPYSSGWVFYTPLTATIPMGQWTCTPALGRPNLSGGPTPGIMCTGTYGSPATFHLDTSYLISPVINNPVTYNGHFYLQFDTKTSVFHPGSRLDILVTDTTIISPGTVIVNIDSLITPVFSNGDATNWVTHQADISRFKGTFYLAFRYSSTVDSGSTWYLDNVNTSLSRLAVSTITDKALPLTAIGVSTGYSITLSYTIQSPGIHFIVITDLMGRVVYNERINVATGTQNHTINGLGLHGGMYFIKMGDGNVLGSTKVIIE